MPSSINSESSIAYPLISGRVAAVETLSVRGLLSPEASSTLRSRKCAQRSARDSFADVGVDSVKNSVLSEGVLGVLWKGEIGSRRELLEAPGLARPAFSRSSSDQLSRPAMICKI
jgi:hypothetical protein